MHLPLPRVAMCLDCEECFEIDRRACPACGSSTMTTLARFLERRSATLVSGMVTRLRRRSTPSKVVIVARNQLTLYEQLTRILDGKDTVKVILDRRNTTSRDRPRGSERRHADRARSIEAQLRTLGCAVVVLDDDEAELSRASGGRTVRHANGEKADRRRAFGQ